MHLTRQRYQKFSQFLKKKQIAILIFIMTMKRQYKIKIVRRQIIINQRYEGTVALSWIKHHDSVHETICLSAWLLSSDLNTKHRSTNVYFSNGLHSVQLTEYLSKFYPTFNRIVDNRMTCLKWIAWNHSLFPLC